MKPFVLDQKVTLQRFTATQDEYGEEVQTWANLGDERAKKFQGRGDERRAAAREQGTKVATFMMHSNSRTRGLLVRDRIVHDGANWDITDVSDDTPQRGFLEATATRVVE
ncbi:head-tail adaptor protein [Sphingopyxis sp. 550A]